MGKIENGKTLCKLSIWWYNKSVWEILYLETLFSFLVIVALFAIGSLWLHNFCLCIISLFKHWWEFLFLFSFFFLTHLSPRVFILLSLSLSLSPSLFPFLLLQLILSRQVFFQNHFTSISISFIVLIGVGCPGSEQMSSSSFYSFYRISIWDAKAPVKNVTAVLIDGVVISLEFPFFLFFILFYFIIFPMLSFWPPFLSHLTNRFFFFFFFLFCFRCLIEDPFVIPMTIFE